MTARTTILIGLLIALLASGCGAASREQGTQPPTARPPALYTVGKSLLGVPGRARVTLAAAPVTPLAGWLTPAAVPSPDGRYIAYNAWHEIRKDDPALSWKDQGISQGDPLARPSIRLHDLQTSADKPMSTVGSRSPGGATAPSPTSRGPSASTARVSIGSITPSSQSLAVE